MREPVHRVHTFSHITGLHMHIVPAISPSAALWRTSVDFTDTAVNCGRPNRPEFGTSAESRHFACTVGSWRSYGHPSKDRTLKQGRFRRFCPCFGIPSSVQYYARHKAPPKKSTTPYVRRTVAATWGVFTPPELPDEGPERWRARLSLLCRPIGPRRPNT